MTWATKSDGKNTRVVNVATLMAQKKEKEASLDDPPPGDKLMTI